MTVQVWGMPRAVWDASKNGTDRMFAVRKSVPSAKEEVRMTGTWDNSLGDIRKQVEEVRERCLADTGYQPKYPMTVEERAEETLFCMSQAGSRDGRLGMIYAALLAAIADERGRCAQIALRTCWRREHCPSIA